MRDASPYVEHALYFQLIEADEGENELAKRGVIIATRYSRLWVFVKPLIVRLVEAPEPIHGAEVYPKDRNTVGKGALGGTDNLTGRKSQQSGW
jgi:hypothetical protein